MTTFISEILRLGDERAARRFGLTKRAVASYRRGERQPCRSVVEKLREQEGWSYDQIFSGLPEKKTSPDSSIAAGRPAAAQSREVLPHD